MYFFLIFSFLLASANAGHLNFQRAIDIPIERFAQVEQNSNLLPGPSQPHPSQRLVTQQNIPNYPQVQQPRPNNERPYNISPQQRSSSIPPYQQQQQQQQQHQPQQPPQQPPQPPRKSKGGFPSEILAQVLNSKTPEQVPHIPKDSGVTFLHARPLFEFSVTSTKPVNPKKYHPKNTSGPVQQQPLPQQQQKHQQQQQQQQPLQHHPQRQQYLGNLQGSQQAVGTAQFNPRNNPYLTPVQPQRLPEISRAPVQPAPYQRQQQQQPTLHLQGQQLQQQQPQQPHAALPPRTTVTYI